MSEPTDDEYRDWKDLTASPGWARLKAYAAELSGPAALERHVVLALDNPDEQAIMKLRRIVDGKKAIAAMMAHPYSRMGSMRGTAEGEPETPHMGRRGAL